MKEDAKEVVKRILKQYIKSKPAKISLRLSWDSKHSEISLEGNGVKETVEYSDIISFSSFAHGVIEAYEEIYGRLSVVPVSFREEIYRNDKVSLDLYPTGSLGIFDIYVEYGGE